MHAMPLVRRCRLLTLIAATSLAGRAMWAQPVSTQLGVTAGAGTDARGIHASTLTVTPGVVLFPRSPVTLALMANGTRFAGDAWQAGADALLSARSGEWTRLTLTMNAAGSYVRTSYRTTFAAGEAVPALELRLGQVTAFGGVRIASGRTDVRGTSLPGAVPAPVAFVSSTSTSRGPTFGAQWQALGGDLPLSLSYREDHNRVAGAWFVDRMAGASFAVGRLLLGGSVGRRESPAESVTFANGSALLRLTSALSLQGGVGRYPSSLLTGAAGGRYVSVGLMLRSGVPRRPSLPRPTGVPAVRAPETRLSIRAPDATRVELAGDWNDWTPVPARRAANGVWYVDVALAPGEYRYAFRVDGGAWRVPEGAVTSDDGFGGKSAYVTVSTIAARHTTHNQEDQ